MVHFFGSFVMDESSVPARLVGHIWPVINSRGFGSFMLGSECIVCSFERSQKYLCSFCGSFRFKGNLTLQLHSVVVWSKMA